MRIHGPGSPLRLDRLADPAPGPGQILVKVSACGVCRTDLHVADGEVPACRYPITPGHEVVGTVHAVGNAVARWKVADRVGIPWLGWTCGECEYCASGRENLCERAQFTGCHLDGGYAEYLVADERFCLPIPERYGNAEAAPLLCAGLIGFRCYLKCGDAKNLGLYGFGAAAHILTQIARADGRQVFAFTRRGDSLGQAFARHGHLAGDAVLQAVAARTKACVREADTVARIGGDELAIILVGTAETDAGGVLAKVVAANAAPVRYDGNEIHATVSVGASGYPRDAVEEQALRKQADGAMYAAKAAGGNRYVFYRR